MFQTKSGTYNETEFDRLMEDFNYNIIKKVDKDFNIIDIEFYDEIDSEITNTIRMSIDDTYFEFGIFNYIESHGNDDKWADKNY